MPSTPPPPLRTERPAHQRQSRVLTGLLLGLLVLVPCLRSLESLAYHPVAPAALLLSLVFALLAWRLRAATPAAAAAGGLVCLLLCTAVHRDSDAWVASRWLHAPAGLLALILLFVLTFTATRFGRSRKQQLGLAEHRSGRRCSQVLANLGIAALAASAGFYPGALAALAEATADTVSSEVGQALGGPTVLLTTGRPVPPGTDGGISLLGTAAGLLTALLVVTIGLPRAGNTPLRLVAFVFAGAFTGFVADSLLGATLERRGYLGNDAVNTLSTLAAALATTLLCSLV